MRNSMRPLAAALAASGKRRDAGALLRTADVTAALSTQRDTHGVLNSATRSTSLLLSAWLAVNPRHAAVPPIVRRLESLQRRMLTEHLNRWVPSYAREQRNRSDTGFYRAMLDLAAGFVEWDAREGCRPAHSPSLS